MDPIGGRPYYPGDDGNPCLRATRIPTRPARTGPMTHPTREQILDAARGLIPVLRARAPEAERIRRIPDETIADLRAAGLLEHSEARALWRGGDRLPADDRRDHRARARLRRHLLGLYQPGRA